MNDIDLDLFHTSVAIIDLDKISENLAIVRKKTQNKKIIAMVKANAYGHGLVRVAEHLASEGVDYLGTAFIDEAILLRQAGISMPIITTGPFSKYQIGQYIENKIDFTIASIEALNEVDEAAGFFKRNVNIHLAVDSGMMRIGVRHSNASQFFEAANKAKNCKVQSVFSHFASADNEDLRYTKLQLERFLEATNFYEKHDLEKPDFHIANSAAILNLPASHLDMVRPGILLYGYCPSNHLKYLADLKPVLELKTKVLYFKVILKGSPVGYGGTWCAPDNCRAVTVPIGYADGYRRGLSNKSEVLIHGFRYPVVGAIGMDQMVVNLGNGEAYKGDEVVLIGKQGNEYISADELAEHLNTINYEILTGISQRVKRIYISAKKVSY